MSHKFKSKQDLKESYSGRRGGMKEFRQYNRKRIRAYKEVKRQGGSFKFLEGYK